MNLTTLIKEKRHFIVPFLFFIIAVGIIQVLFNRDEIHLYINQFHSPFADTLFLYITYLGGGLAFGILLIYLFIKNRTKAYIFGAGYASVTIFVQALKRTIFSDITRPLGYFQWREIDIYQVPGVGFKSQFSFPSGHSADIFFVACCFVLLENIPPSKQRLLFYIALLVGFSRVYLSLHFLIDIYVGAILGVLFSFVAFKTGSKYLHSKEI